MRSGLRVGEAEPSMTMADDGRILLAAESGVVVGLLRPPDFRCGGRRDGGERKTEAGRWHRGVGS